MYSFIETKLFSRLLPEYLTDDEYAQLQEALVQAPDRGARKTRNRASRVTFFAKLRRRSMAKTKRNIGVEILEGIREIKRGDHGRVVNVPSVGSVRERTGLSQ